MRQDQFLDVIDRDEAERRFQAALDPHPLGEEEVALDLLLGRVLARDVVAPVDVPSFDRSNVDGFAVRAEDVFGCSEEEPARLTVVCDALVPGQSRTVQTVPTGGAAPIATGAMIPRGANAVVMVEYTDLEKGESEVIVRRPVAPGDNVTFAGTDIGQGETVLRRGELLTSRETGVLAALGLASAWAVRRPRVAILSTGDELIPPGAAMQPGLVFDSNARTIGDAVRELGCEAVHLGIVPDDLAQLQTALRRGLDYDAVLLSGGTSKGAGDLSYRVVRELGEPGIIAHGVALKPGKPLCLAAVRVADAGGATRTIPVVILPGFPTSAIFTFREFVAPVLRRMAGRSETPMAMAQAKLPFRVNSERGRTEYLLVGLMQGSGESAEVAAYPMGKGSGSVTAFSRADGFIVIPRQREYVEAGEAVTVHLLGQGESRLPDLVVIGSHCTGLDFLLGELAREGIRSKVLSVGSTGGMQAARRGECDLAGIHLLDPATGTYNLPYVSEELRLVRGYGRLQGVVHRAGDVRFQGKEAGAAVADVLADAACVMVNRNRGSGTRLLIDRLLGGAKPAGYWTEAKSHNAVAAAVAQGRADWGVALEPVARAAGLGFLPLQDEQYDFVVPQSRWDRPGVVAFRRLIERPEIRRALEERGFRCEAASGAGYSGE